MRQRIAFDHQWKFALGHAADASRDFEFARDRSLVKSGEARGAASANFTDAAWRIVDLPHDWAIELPFVQKDDREHIEHGFHAIGPDFPENSVGWYRKTFNILKNELGLRIGVEFDGVFRDSVVWINGHRLGRRGSGHAAFRYDLTDFLNYGGPNTLVVRVDATQYEGWWYEGAGIYRHAWLVKTGPLHIAADGVQVISKVAGDRAVVTVRTTVCNESDEPARFVLSTRAIAREENQNARRTRSPGLQSGAFARTTLTLAPWQLREITQRLTIANPNLWSPDTPNLHLLQSEIRNPKSEIQDAVETPFGIRTARWDSRKGFFLNNRPLKIKGTCNHQQHAGVGTAVPDGLIEWRLRRLKAMGSNAYRCSHYPVSRETLDLCDRIGLLVMAENRLAGSAPEFLRDFEDMIRRDRNHPSIILWSIGNEEHTIQWSVAGERIGKTLIRRAHALDPTRGVTCAMHDRGLGEGFANVVDVHGWNYINVGDIEKYHASKPDQPIVGSEEGSTVCTRGEYLDNAAKGYVSAYDKRSPKWGTTAEHWWKFFADREWITGGFVWTGFDYKGEPIPYKWPCTTSHFGLMDLCGFPKDNYWYFKSWWSNAPVLHLFPHWNWPGKEGEEIDVRCFTNHDEVELFVNGDSAGRKPVPRNSHAGWLVKYTPGAIEVIAYRGGKRVETKRIETTGATRKLILEIEEANGCHGSYPTRDVSSQREHGSSTTRGSRTNTSAIVCASVRAIDSRNRFVPVANNAVKFEVSDNAKILGVGNGDPSSHEPDHASERKLFNGRAMLILQRAGTGEITITAKSKSLTATKLMLPEIPPTKLNRK